MTKSGIESCRGIRTDKVIDLLVWARTYEKYNSFPLNSEKRFLVAMYQFQQGLQWKTNNGEQPSAYYESVAASVIHLMCFAEGIDLFLEKGNTIDGIEFITTYSVRELNIKDIFTKFGKIAKDIVYSGTSSTRKIRFKPNTFRLHIVELICTLIRLIPTKKRVDSFEVATEIMTRTL